MNTDNYTRYLTVRATTPSQFSVQLSAASPIDLAQSAIRDCCELRYSPVMPAFLSPNEGPPALPSSISSIAFLFSNAPYNTLGELKPKLDSEELAHSFFTEGLASILLLNCTYERACEIVRAAGGCPLEFWPIRGGTLEIREIITEVPSQATTEKTTLDLPTTTDPEIAVYVEQIAASVSSLWASYGIYLPDERKTLYEITHITRSIVNQFSATKQLSGGESALIRQKKANAIISALVELSAALSYAVTQGTSGAVPILWNRSPFPHHSLLGIGGSVRALTKFTRYLESAFLTRSAGRVISSHYSHIKRVVPASISTYTSGDEYRFPETRGESADECFDSGGDFHQKDQIPLLTHFSLRHGFMESKFSVTAASEALTSEIMPQWTLMTLSHEIMHSRVRTIIQALFGHKWDDHEYTIVRPEYWRDFCAWLEARKTPKEIEIATGLRNVILNFCHAIEQSANPVASDKDVVGRRIPHHEISESYTNHKQLAVELIVHFHDYYFAYAYQPKMYMMSLWASWIKVAAPFIRTPEYLIRSLATVACGTGLPPREAFNYAVEVLTDALDALETAGVQSPLFDELRRLTTGDEVEVETSRAFFKPCYYLIDQVRLFFASPLIASKIDRIEADPFAEGSTSAEDYSANIYVFADDTQEISPIRYSLAVLFSTMSRKLPVNDQQWLTAWNYMVISSQKANL